MRWRRDIDGWFIAEVLPHAARFRAYARRLCANAEEADDLVQEAYAQALASENIRDVRSAKAFVLRIMRNLAIDKARRAKIVSIEHIPDLDALGQADPAPDPHAHLAGRQELARLEAAIRALPAQCRQVVTLRKVFEMSPPQIAERLQISVSTVEKHLNKGMRLIAEALAFTPPPGDETDRSEWVKRTKTDERS